MKNIIQYIIETKASSAVNKMKAEIAKNWPEDRVCIVNHKFKFYMLLLLIKYFTIQILYALFSICL